MTVYYIKQDNSIPGCGESGCCGEYYEDIEKTFFSCDCLPIEQMTADHLQGCKGGGPILKWRKATEKELLAFSAGSGEGHEEGYFIGLKNGKARENERTIKLLEEYYWVGDKSEYGLSKFIAFVKGETDE